MALTEADIAVVKSVVGASEGGISTLTEIISGVDGNLWADVPPSSASAGGTMIRKDFIRNESSTDVLPPYAVYVSASPTGVSVDLGVGVDSTADTDPTVGDLDPLSANAVIQLVSDGTDVRTVRLIGANAAGAPAEEVVTLTGTTAVAGATTFSRLFAAVASATSSTRTVTIKQGVGGTVLGTIKPNKILTFGWFSTTGLTDAIVRVTLALGSTHGLWERMTWPPATAGLDPAVETLALRTI